MKTECGESAFAKAMEDIVFPSRYLDLQLIGKGSTSVVLKGHDSFLARDVAIKYIRRELKDHTSIRRFQQEAKVLSSFNLMHLPVVLDFGLTPCGHPFMVMELVEGESLRDVLRERGTLPPDLAIAIMLQLLDAVKHAHERGVVHRDLKSQNIMISWKEDGSPFVKVVDFGLAKSTRDSGFITAIGVAVGTPLYMSPEQALGRTTDERSDIYSLGCVLFEMLTGVTPFQREGVTRTINAHISEPAPKLRALGPSSARIYGELERIVEKMLEKDPICRYASATSAKAELESLMLRSDLKTESKVEKAPTSFLEIAEAAPNGQGFKTRPYSLLIMIVMIIMLFSTTICSALDACEPRPNCHLPNYQRHSYAIKQRPHREQFHFAGSSAYAMPTTNDNDLRVLKEFKNIKYLNLVASEVTGEGLNEIENLEIETLHLDALSINQRGFNAIGKMPKLGSLRIDYQQFLSGTKLAALKPCANLWSLSVSNTYLSRQAQIELSSLAGLTELNLDGVTGMNDDTLRLLQEGLPNLRNLSIKSGKRKFSEHAIAQFQRARSDVHIRI